MKRRELVKALKDAAKAGDVGAIRAALASGADPNDSGRRGDYSPLYLAAQNGHLLAVQYLCEHGADPNIPSNLNGGNTPLMAALQKGRVSVVECLLANGVRWEPSSRGTTALIQCALLRDLAAVPMAQALLDAGVDPNAVSYPLQQSGLFHSSLWNEWFKNSIILGIATPLTFACYRHNEPVARLFLERGADPNAPVGFVQGARNALGAIFWPRSPAWEVPKSRVAQERAFAHQIVLALLEAGAIPSDRAKEWAAEMQCPESVQAMEEWLSRPKRPAETVPAP
jgi:ankyrin repeat protein